MLYLSSMKKLPPPPAERRAETAREDIELLRLAGGTGREREHAAAELYRRYHGVAMFNAQKYLPREQAEELVQEVFLEAFRKYDPKTHDRGFRSYIAMMARSRAIDKDRQAHGRERPDGTGLRMVRETSLEALQEGEGTDGQRTHFEKAVAKDPSPLDVLADSNEAERIRARLTSYPNPRHAQIFVWYMADGLGMKEIAKRLGVHESRVSQIMTRSAEKIRAHVLAGFQKPIRNVWKKKEVTPAEKPPEALPESSKDLPQAKSYRDVVNAAWKRLMNDLEAYQADVDLAEQRVRKARKALDDLT